MDEIKIGAEIVFNITGNHNIGYAKGEKYIGTVLSEDHRSRLYVRTIGMPRACIDERDVEWVIDPDGDFDMDEAIPNPMARELYKLMGRYVYTFGRSHESINGYIVYECMMMDRDLRYNVMYALHDHGFEIRHIDSYSWWMTNERLMSEVTYTEGDIHIIVHECMEDYVDNVKFGGGGSFIKTSKHDKILTCDGDDNINTAKRKRRHAPRPEAGRDRGTGVG